MQEHISKIPKNRLAQIILKNKAVSRDCGHIVFSRKNRVNLNAWVIPNGSHHNLGDYLSIVILEHICDLLDIDIDKETKQTKHLYAIGSILLGFQDLTVWGSGFICDRTLKRTFWLEKIIHRFWHKTDVRAVRGPESRRILLEMGIHCPEIYGDPAVLLPLFYYPDVEKTRDYLLIPHFSRFDNYADWDNKIGTFTSDWKSMIDKILSAKYIISSSLHGLILAEAYGIPAVMLNDTPSKDITKYKDYYFSTGRYTFPIANSVEEALQMDIKPLDISVINTLQENLLGSFPKDLWENKYSV